MSMNADANVIAVQGHAPRYDEPLSFSGQGGTSYGSVPFTARHDQPGKRIAVPVRVEPKVFFANERTFLS
ncbi:hypothetical protein GGH95_005250, partial [Coemansia sp. RSA 1836]